MADDRGSYVPGSRVWIAASILFGRDVPARAPYPCLCSSPLGCERKRNPAHCQCYGRNDDLKHLPRTCCAVRAAARARFTERIKQHDN